MKLARSNRWEVAKRFLRHSEKLLDAKNSSFQALAEALLKAVKEVCPQSQMRLVKDRDCLSLVKNRLQHSLFDPMDSFFDKAEAHDFNQGKAILWMLPQGLENNKLQYFNLIKTLFQERIANLETKPNPIPPIAETPPTSREPSDEPLLKTSATKSIKARYREQKAIILMLENYALKKSQTQMFREFEARPELGEEIIKLQNRLIRDIDTMRQEKELAIQESRLIKRLLGDMMELGSGYLAMTKGLLELKPKVRSEAKEFTSQLDDAGLFWLKNLQVLFELIADDLLSREEPLVHSLVAYPLEDALCKLVENLGQGRQMEAEITFPPQLETWIVKADKKLLNQALSMITEMMSRLFLSQTDSRSARIMIDAAQKGELLEVSMTMDQVRLEPAARKALESGRALSDLAGEPYWEESLLRRLSEKALLRQGGSLDFGEPEKGKLQIKLRLPLADSN